METVYVFLAEGFEEIEAITPVDLLRRAGVEVKTVGVTGDVVTGAHGVPVKADLPGAGFALPDDAAMIVLPGGGPGTENLAASGMVADALKEAEKRDIYIAAICAAPTILYKRGLLAGKRATVFPTMRDQMKDVATGGAVEVDGKIITGRSAGVARQFAQALIAALCGTDKAEEVVQNIYP